MEYLRFYALETECQTIFEDEFTEFNRIWICCICYGLGFGTLICAPFILCRFGSRASSKVLDFDDMSSPRTPASAKSGQDGDEGPPPLSLAEEEQPVKPPNLEEARLHLLESSPTVGGKWRGVFFGTGMGQMSEVGGVGTELYFRLLFCLGYAFAFMSIATGPILVFSSNGNFLPDNGNALGKTTTGNLGMVAQGGLDQAERLVIIGCQGMPLADLTPYFGYLDVASVLIFMGMVCYFRFKILPKMAKAAEEETLTVADFCLEVDFLPREIADQASYEDQLRQHFEDVIVKCRELATKGGCCKRRKEHVELPVGMVQEVTLVRDWHHKLGEIKDRATLMQKKKIAEFKGDQKSTEKLTAKIDKIDVALNKTLKPEAELPVVRAYVTLNTPMDAHAVLNYYRFSDFLLFRLCNCCQSSSKRFAGNLIRVRRPPEPSNIICENADVSWSERLVRKATMFCCWMLAVFVAGALIFGVQGTAAAESNKGATSVSLGSDSCDVGQKPSGYQCPYQNATLWTKEFARNSTGDVLNCYCSTKGFGGVYQDAELYEDICYDWLYAAARGIVIGICASVIVVILNVGFKNLILAFADFERPLSLSSLMSSKMTKMFISQYVNTALIVLVINYYNEGFGFMLFGFIPIAKGSFGDFERGWYANVGAAMITNLMTNAVIAGPLGLIPCVLAKVMRCCFARSTKTQDELLELYTNPPFDMSERYAKVLMTCFCTLMYSGGMPILNSFGAIFCFVTYWSDKIILLWGSKRPPMFDTAMPKQASTMLLLTAPLHALFTLGMYSQSCTFPSVAIGGSLASLSDQALGGTAQAGAFIARWAKRATLESTWLLFIVLLFFIVLLVLMLLSLVIGATFGEAWKFITKTLCASSAVVPKEDGDKEEGDGAKGAGIELKTWDDPAVQEHLKSSCPPLSYGFESNPEFEPLVKYLRMGSQILTPHSSKSGSSPKVKKSLEAAAEGSPPPASEPGAEAEAESPPGAEAEAESPPKSKTDDDAKPEADA